MINVYLLNLPSTKEKLKLRSLEDLKTIKNKNTPKTRLKKKKKKFYPFVHAHYFSNYTRSIILKIVN